MQHNIDILSCESQRSSPTWAAILQCNPIRPGFLAQNTAHILLDTHHGEKNE